MHSIAALARVSPSSAFMRRYDAGPQEEVGTSQCLRSIGIMARAAVDEQHREMVLIDPPEHMLLWERAQWWCVRPLSAYHSVA